MPISCHVKYVLRYISQFHAYCSSKQLRMFKILSRNSVAIQESTRSNKFLFLKEISNFSRIFLGYAEH